jgi:hypothetical protein
MELDREHPGVKQSMIKALANVVPRHLLDRRLNPPADLVRRAGEARPAPIAAAHPPAPTAKTAALDENLAILAVSAVTVRSAASSSE